jgi:hypothetical protein
VLKVFIGHDGREQDAYDVAEFSLKRHSSIPISVTPLHSDRLRSCGLLNRPMDRREGLYDLNSGAYQATEFANSRFAVPILAQTGWALFIDCDMLFTRDIADLFRLRNPSKAVQVVKHTHIPREREKMDGAEQSTYPRKNWSSVILWNVDHKANRRLNLQMLNSWPGRDLHAFNWLADEEIGDLPQCWNWLVGVQPEPERLGNAHYTLGGPWISAWKHGAINGGADDLWAKEFKLMKGMPK